MAAPFEDLIKAFDKNQNAVTANAVFRQLGKEQFTDELISFSAQTNVDTLRRRAASPEQSRRIVMMGDYITQYPHYDYVPDPYYEGSEGFELVLDLLEDACATLLDRILAGDFAHGA